MPQTVPPPPRAWPSVSRAEWTVLAAIMAAGLLLRVANLGGWWSIYNDYDEGAWAMGARLIAEGHVPYRDFLLVHPPLYEYVLALVYLVLGFDFVLGRMVAVVFSLATVPLAWHVARRAFGGHAGLWAAFAFAFSPVLVFAGRRVVPDAFAVFLAVAAIGIALSHLRAPTGRKALALGGVLGLLALVKFTHLMTVAAIGGAWILAMQPDAFWRRAARFVRPPLLLATGLLMVGGYAFLFALRHRFDLAVKLPLLDDFFMTRPDLLLLGALVLVPYALAWWLLSGRRAGEAPPPQQGAAAPEPFAVRLPWRHLLLSGGAGLGAGILALGPALVLAPQAFLEQTILLQSNRPGVIAPSLLQFVRYFVGHFEPVSFYQAEVLLVLPLAWLAFTRGPRTPQVRFLAIGGLLAMLFAQPLGSFPRYYIAVYPFTMLLVGALFAGVRWRRPVEGLRPFGAAAMGVAFVALSVQVPAEYWGYDIANTITDPREEQLNRETLDFLRTLSPTRVWATSPTLLLLDPELPAATSFDTFGYMWLLGESVHDVLNRTLAEGTDVVVITPWSHLWGGEFGEKSQALNEAIRARGTLIKVIGRDPVYHMEVYHVSGAGGSRLFNPSLDLLEEAPGGVAPLGWRRVEFANEGSHANATRMEEDGRAFTRLDVHQSGTPGQGDWVHVGFMQDVSFPDLQLQARVRTTAMTTESNETHIESGIQFRDQDGRWLIVGFGGGVGAQRFDRPEHNWSLTVLPVQSGEWADLRFDVSALWAERGWPEPERVTAEVYAAAHWRRPGDYSFDVEWLGS